MCYVIVGLNNAQTFDEDVKDDNGCYVTNEDEYDGQNLNGKFAIVIDFVLEEVGFHKPTDKNTITNVRPTATNRNKQATS